MLSSTLGKFDFKLDVSLIFSCIYSSLKPMNESFCWCCFSFPHFDFTCKNLRYTPALILNSHIRRTNRCRIIMLKIFLLIEQLSFLSESESNPSSSSLPLSSLCLLCLFIPLSLTSPLSSPPHTSSTSGCLKI